MTSPSTIDWQFSRFADLTPFDLYDVLAARQNVFILEQTCLYPDIDGYDLEAHHLLGWRDVDGKRQLAAYLRVLAPGAKYDEMSIGRVITTTVARGSGAGRALMLEGMAEHQRRYPGQPNTIGGQAYLNAFYESLGFETISEVYLEDDIEHYHMRWTPPA